MPVQAPRDQLRVTGDETPDLQINDHPVFRALVDEGGNNRPLTRRIRIDRFLPIDPDWKPEDSPATEVLATIRNTDPLVLSKRFGDGQVVTFLTTVSPTWNNWARGPSFPVVVLQLHGFLSSARNRSGAVTTGEAITMQLDTTTWQPTAEFSVPGKSTGSASVGLDDDAALTFAEKKKMTTMKLEPQPQQADAALSTFVLGGQGDGGQIPVGSTATSGTYVANLVTLDGQPRQRRFVVNPPLAESDLSLLQNSELAEQLDGLGVEIHSSDELEYGNAGRDGFSWSQLLAGLLIALLIGEQLLAYSASYHPAKSAARKGGNEV